VSYHANIIVRQSIQAAGGLAYLFWLNGKMAAAAMFGLLLMGAISHFNGAYSRWLATKITDETADANAVAEQALGLVRLVRTHAAEGVEAAKYSGKLGNIMALEEAQVRAGGGLFARIRVCRLELYPCAKSTQSLLFFVTGMGLWLGPCLVGGGVLCGHLGRASHGTARCDVGRSQWRRCDRVFLLRRIRRWLEL
jgi:ABC-type multidrug transport system fused ATPase/permease subunit